MKNIAIVGFGRAGYAAAQTLRSSGFAGNICVYTDYTTGVENPMLTTYYASGKIEESEVMPFGNLESIAAALNLELRPGVKVKKIIPETLEVVHETAQPAGSANAGEAAQPVGSGNVAETAQPAGSVNAAETAQPAGSGREAAAGRALELAEKEDSRNTALPASAKMVVKEPAKEERESFDEIIIATGSAPILPDFEAKDPARIITIRNIGDARRMNYALHHSKKVLVVGCSMIGIKVVQGLTEHEADITFIDFADKVFPTAVLPGMDKILEERIAHKGVKLLLNTGINAIREVSETATPELTTEPSIAYRTAKMSTTDHAAKSTQSDEAAEPSIAYRAAEAAHSYQASEPATTDHPAKAAAKLAEHTENIDPEDQDKNRNIHSEPLKSNLRLEAEFSDGTKDEYDAVFLCMGTRARIDLVKGTTIKTARAIKVDRHMRTSAPHIWAAGDCCETYELSTGQSVNVALWANAAEQGRIAAENILGKGSEYAGNLICNITHFWDTDFVSIGNNRAEGELVEFSGVRPDRRASAQTSDESASAGQGNEKTSGQTYAASANASQRNEGACTQTYAASASAAMGNEKASDQSSAGQKNERASAQTRAEAANAGQGSEITSNEAATESANSGLGEWHFAAVIKEGRLQCVNMIDLPELSGTFRDIMWNQFTGQKNCRPYVLYNLGSLAVPSKLEKLIAEMMV